MKIIVDEIKYEDPFGFYCRHSQNEDDPSLLMESRSANLAYGKLSIAVPEVSLKITGKNEEFSIEALNELGEAVLHAFGADDFDYASKMQQEDRRISGRVKKADLRNLSETERIRQPNTSFVIRTMLEKFRHIADEHFGLYGAFAYDFARNFENFGTRFSEGGEPDFELYLPSTLVHFDDIRERAFVKRLEFDGHRGDLTERVHSNGFEPEPFRMTEDMSLDEYADKVSNIIEQIRNGRAMQCVLSRTQGMSLRKPPIESYGQLRDTNPSPYSFYFSLGDGRYLYGASPELHIGVRNGEIEIRPIAGTKVRPEDKCSYKDYLKRVELLTDTKELREHTMLVDLARHEMYRLCDARSVNVTDMFTIESYPNLHHLVSGVKGRLRSGIDALDALLTTIPAGTLSGAPKLEAMRMIEELENSRRDFYGGAIGYLTFGGNCNTGITIRSVFVKDGMSYMRAGAGIVVLSDIGDEIIEIGEKARKGMGVLK